MRRLIVASAILATILITPFGLTAATSTPSTSPTDSERATAALGYLLAAQGADGSIDASISETADFVIGAAVAGYDPATLHGCGAGTGALDYLATASDGVKVVADAAATGKAILAVVAAGDDPASFQGRHLTSQLDALYHSGTGAYGDGSTFSQSFAVLALVASGGTVPSAATAELAGLQGTDGSWSYGTAAPAPGTGDSNSTAIALMALDQAGVHSADTKALAYLKTQQVDDGGFVYSTAWGSTSDPDSDSVVLQALVAAGEDPTGAAWLKTGGNVLTALRSNQGADGGFIYPGSGESAFTTSQVPAALMLAPYAAAVHFTAGNGLGTSACPSPTPTATATPTASPTATPTATPTASPAPKSTARPTVRPTPRLTVRRTAAPTIVPTPTPAEAASAEPTPTPTSTPTEPVSPSPSASSAVAAETSDSSPGPAAGGTSAPSDSSGGIPAPLIYALAGLGGAIIVLCGGWLVLARPAKP
jgi:hypothetical protein